MVEADVIEVPAELARITADREGADGTAWIAALPGIAADLLGRWDCTPCGAPACGQVGLIVPVTRRGVPAVLKVSFPHPGNVHEPDAYTTWRGRGAVRLYERDDARFALLLERAGSRTLAGLGDHERALQILGELSARLAVPAPDHVPRLRERVPEWEAELAAAARLLPGYAVDTALDTIRTVAVDQPDLLVHGDLHYGNVLAAEREPWLAIDPKGYAGDPAYDAETALLGGAETLLVASDLRGTLLRRIAIFADAAGLDRRRTCRWVQARLVMGAHHARRFAEPEPIVRAYEQVLAALTPLPC